MPFSFLNFSLYFNSIKVRLELDVRQEPITFNEFQFHKGTIRTGMNGKVICQDTHFNSIKVRLERKNNIITSSAILFQFHKGTIRTFLISAKNRLQSPFQFHKGTIRTRRWYHTGEFLFHFNSIKVRLELTEAADISLIPSFQFHKGTIRTAGAQ